MSGTQDGAAPPDRSAEPAPWAPWAREPATPRAIALMVAGIAAVWLPVLMLHLVSALFAALTTVGATRGLAAWFQRRWPSMRHPHGVALALIVVLLGAVLFAVVEGAASARSAARLAPGAWSAQIEAIIDRLRDGLPPSIAAHLPASFEALRETVVHWVRTHAGELQIWGGHGLRVVAHVLIGIVIGAMLAIELASHEGAPADRHPDRWPLPRQARIAFEHLVDAFTTFVFAQVRISAINTALTAVFVLGVLPLFGRPLPMGGALVVLTFVVGLLPVVGNLISNSIIVAVALSDSPLIAALSLAWLVAIHKLEYFLNAHIIGSRIHARAWELLIAMLVMESAFGLPGLVSAPVIYAQIKAALRRHGWAP